MKLSTQRRLAAEVLGVGLNRVWIDPTRTSDVAAAITREDVRRLIRQGAIKAKAEVSVSRGRARERAMKRKKGRRRGPGSRKGARGARSPKKRMWIKTVRPLRGMLGELKRKGSIDARQYRRLYLMVKGGTIKSKAHLRSYLRERGIAV